MILMFSYPAFTPFQRGEYRDYRGNKCSENALIDPHGLSLVQNEGKSRATTATTTTATATEKSSGMIIKPNGSELVPS